MTLQFRTLYDISSSDTIGYFILSYSGILWKSKLTQSNTVGRYPTCKLATFKKFRLVPSKGGIYSKRQLSVLLISVEIYKKKVTIWYKTNLKVRLYNVIGLHVSL